MNDQPQHDGERPANELPPSNMTDRAQQEHEPLLWELRRAWQRRQEALLACQLLEAAAALLRRARLEEARREKRRRRRALQARAARPRVVTWYA